MGLILGLTPLCSKRKEDERGFGAAKGFSPCPTSRGGAQGTGSAGEPGGAGEHQQEQDPASAGNGREERGEVLGGHKKNPRRRHSKGLKASTALRSGNGSEQESLREREDGKKSGMGEKRGLRRSRMGCIPSTCWSSSEPAGVKPSRGSPRINHRNKRVVLVRPQPARQERERIVIINNH